MDELLLLRIGGRTPTGRAMVRRLDPHDGRHEGSLCACASDVEDGYPVLLSFETYRQTFHYVRESGLPAEDVDKVLNHNAQILLGLEH